MGLNIIYALGATFVAFAFVVYLEIKGINHKICDWVLKAFGFIIPLKDALSIYANSVSYKSNFDYNQKRFKQLWKDNDNNLIPQELFTLLQLVQDEKLTFYGRKSFSSVRVPLQPIPKEYLNYNNKHNWSKDYSTLYYDDSKDIAYTDISVKDKELKSLLDKVRNLYDY